MKAISTKKLKKPLKVMIDFDLAEMYGIETRVLKQAVRSN